MPEHWIVSPSQKYPYRMTPTVLLSLVLPVVAIIITFWGFRRSTRADKLRAFFEIQDRYLASDARAGRRVLHALIAASQWTRSPTSTPPISAVAGYALAVMNSIAIACEAGYVEQDLLARSMGRSSSSAAVAVAQPYIDYLQQVRGFRPYQFAENLALLLRGSSVGPVSSTIEVTASLRHTPRTRAEELDEQVESNYDP